MKNKVIIIAEAGQNHNGKIRNAYKLVDIAKNCGADFIKFQTSIPELHISKFAKKAKYQKINSPNSKTHLEMSKKLALKYKDFLKIKKYCEKRKIDFLSTPAESKSINFLKTFKMKYFKIGSGEVNNLLYLTKIGKLKKKVILSTGMSTMSEIKRAINILTWNGTRKKNIIVLQCNSEYPTPFKDANIKAMITIKKKFGVNVGFSDHTKGIEASLAAVALGAKVIEKHITIDKKLLGPDHKASINPKELKEMVRSIRNISIALGNGKKIITNSERKNIKIVRPSIVAASEIKKGERFSRKNLTVKRPGTGISPMKFFKIIGKTAKRNFIEDEIIKV